MFHFVFKVHISRLRRIINEKIVSQRVHMQQGPTILHREVCLMLCGSLNGRGVWGRMDTLHVWLSPFTVHLKLPQHCLLISYTPIQNKKSERKKHPVEDHFTRLLNFYTSERLNLCHHTLISALTDTEILVSKLLSFRT